MENFGDYLSPLIVEMVSGKPVVWSSAKKADLISLGTILERVNKAKGLLGLSRNMHVWGSGANSKTTVSEKHYYHCLRGPKSSAIATNGNLQVYGDPGLLAGELIKGCEVGKRKGFGIVAHYADVNTSGLLKLKERFPDAKIINVYSPVADVLKQISSCEMVFSSSMHGLIVADAYSVPNQWVRFSNAFEKFKFEDYFLSHEVEHKPIENVAMIDERLIEEIVCGYARPKLDALKASLIASYPHSL